MRIMVCIKQVPDLEAELEPWEDMSWAGPRQAKDWKMNSYDQAALEAALRLKDGQPEIEIGLISAGPEEAEQVLRRGLGMGADFGIHLHFKAAPWFSAQGLAQEMSRVLALQEAELVFCGYMSEDLMQGQIGPCLAAALGWPCVCAVLPQSLKLYQGGIAFSREAESGETEHFSGAQPLVLTIQSGFCEPRYPSLSKMLLAKKAKIEKIEAKGDLLENAGFEFQGLSLPKAERNARELGGSVQEQARELLKILSSKGVI